MMSAHNHPIHRTDGPVVFPMPVHVVIRGHTDYNVASEDSSHVRKRKRVGRAKTKKISREITERWELL